MSIIGSGKYKKQHYNSFCKICNKSLNIAEDQIIGCHKDCKRKKEMEKENENN